AHTPPATPLDLGARVRRRRDPSRGGVEHRPDRRDGVRRVERERRSGGRAHPLRRPAEFGRIASRAVGARRSHLRQHGGRTYIGRGRHASV
ncbi:MAG: hypothetical protein AVDCRST_MAG11-77, partial [uncultured Gemmatimonadaceae bacterium]